MNKWKPGDPVEQLVAEMQAENATQRARMQIRCEEYRRAIAKHGDPGGHIARMIAVLEDALTPTKETP